MGEYLTTKDVAKRLNLALSTVTYYIRQGELRATKLGRGYRIEEKDLMEFIESRKTK